MRHHTFNRSPNTVTAGAQLMHFGHSSIIAKDRIVPIGFANLCPRCQVLSRVRVETKHDGLRCPLKAPCPVHHNARRQIGQGVAEEILSHQDVELFGRLEQIQSACVNLDMTGFDVRELFRDFVETVRGRMPSKVGH